MHDPLRHAGNGHGQLAVVRRWAAAAAALAFVGCSGTPQPDDRAIAQDYRQHRSQVEVTADGTVVGVLADRSGPSGPHQRFIIRLGAFDLTLLIDHNLSIARRAPVRVGDRVIVHGEYVWNAQGGLIHFTHHDPQGTHEGGFIQDDGQTYG